MKENLWNELTIKKYYDIIALQKENYEDEFDRDIDLVSVVFDVDANRLPLSEFNGYLLKLKTLTPNIPIEDLKETYIDAKYWVDINVANITTAQYMDFENYRKENDLVGMMSCVLLPINHTYLDGYDIDAVKRDIEKMNMIDVHSILNFFLRYCENYTERSLHYLRKNLKKLNLNKEKQTEIEEKLNNLQMNLNGFYRSF